MKVTVLEDDDGNSLSVPDDFSGEWITQWPSGALKSKSSYLCGKSEGDYLCYWENGIICQKGKFIDGQCVGIWEDFREDGSKYKETDFENSLNFNMKLIDENGIVCKTKTVKDGFEVID